VDGATVDDAQPVLRAVTENVVLEIQKTLEFFKATSAVEQIHQIVLSGGVSRVEGLRELLEERLHAPVELFDPFRNVKWNAAKLGNVDPALVASTAAVAVGLALRQAGDR
jgi:type IV pilus assembly protein PilM